MRFSVIVPVYNADKHLKKAVDSVLKQAMQSRFEVEVILVENGSTDGSPKLCDDLAADYHFVTALHREKIGAYAARRLGMETASGEWLLFLDADDALCDGSLDALYEFIRSFDRKAAAPDMFFYDYKKISPSGESIRTFPFEAGRVYAQDDKKAVYDVMCSGDLLNPLWNKCVKRELAHASLAGDHTIFLNHGEDLLQTAQLIDKSEGISYLDRVIYGYVTDNSGLSGSYHREYLDHQITAWERFDDFVADWDKGSGCYKKILDERKSLTCSIAVKNLLMSDLKKSDVSERLKEMLSDSFYLKYACLALPKWASEEDAFFHELQMAGNPYKAMMGYLGKHRIKAFIKARIRK